MTHDSSTRSSSASSPRSRISACSPLQARRRATPGSLPLLRQLQERLPGAGPEARQRALAALGRLGTLIPPLRVAPQREPHRLGPELRSPAGSGASRGKIARELRPAGLHLRQGALEHPEGLGRPEHARAPRRAATGRLVPPPAGWSRRSPPPDSGALPPRRRPCHGAAPAGAPTTHRCGLKSPLALAVTADLARTAETRWLSRRPAGSGGPGGSVVGGASSRGVHAVLAEAPLLHASIVPEARAQLGGDARWRPVSGSVAQRPSGRPLGPHPRARP